MFISLQEIFMTHQIHLISDRLETKRSLCVQLRGLARQFKG